MYSIWSSSLLTPGTLASGGREVRGVIPGERLLLFDGQNAKSPTTDRRPGATS